MWISDSSFKVENKQIKFLSNSLVLPKEGAKIKITWLPYNNGYPQPNVYIGSEGIVEDLDMETGSFVLNMGSSALIICPRKGHKKSQYKFTYI